jgi:hypothetical protein
MPRRRRSAGLFAGLAAVVALAAPLLLGGAAAADPATQKQGARTVAVSESANLPDTDAGITVTGSGFDPAVDAYIAVCRADIAASDPLTACLGGPVPDENDTAGWAEVTSEPEGKRNAAAYGDGGSFTVDLTLSSASDAGVDCVTEGCVLLVRSAGEESGRPKDITIGLGFAVPSSSASSESSTSEAPSTVGPDTVALPDAYLGQQQTVVFTGFTPDEEVGVTVFSEPVAVDGVVASPGGVVAITFPIGEALVPGTHTVQAIGRQSGIVGLASFTVVPAPVTSSASSESSSPSSESSSSAPSTSEAPTSDVSSSAAVTTGVSTTSGEVTPATPSDSGGSLWWLWVTLALLVVAVAVAVAVTASRRRAQQLEQERLDREQELAGMAATDPPTWAGGTGAPYTSPAPPTGPTGYQPYDQGQSYGLLSGREGDGPSLYSGQGVGDGPERYEPPTRWISPEERSGDLPTTAIRPGAGGTPPAGSTPPDPPATQRFDPTENTAADPADPAAPRTEQWSPFGDEDEPGGEPPRRR